MCIVPFPYFVCFGGFLFLFFLFVCLFSVVVVFCFCFFCCSNKYSVDLR